MELFLRILFTSFFILNYNQTSSQDLDFHTPIDAPFDLSGTFGEYRSRFHTGIDFKSRGVQGQKIFSIEEGYVSRIEVNNYGYGKVIYIDHPNGYTSVYAHLKDFSTELDKFVKGEQYRLRKSTIKKFPKKGEIKVKKGELIGYSGNTGGSFGPHLHFEIRDTKTQDALNPLMFNYEYLDNERPIIRGLYLIDEENTLVSSLPSKKEIRKLNDSTYITNDIEFSNRTGLGIDIYDIQYKGLFNRNGVYKVDLYIDSLLVYSFKMDRIKFSQNHYRKIMYDYMSAVKNKKKVLKVYTPQNADLSFLRNNNFNGILEIKNGIVINENITIIHKNSIAEEVKFISSSGDYELGYFFNGSLPVSNGSLVYDNVILEGKSLVHSAELTAIAFKSGVLGVYGGYIVAIGLLLFAFSTAIAWSYYGDRSAAYVFGEKSVIWYRLIYVACFFSAAIIDTEVVWNIAYIIGPLVTVPNIIAMVVMRKEIKSMTSNYVQNTK